MNTFTREDFEHAARAAGIEIIRSRLDDPMNGDMLIKSSPRNNGQGLGPWCPPDDDGDALRLAVRLRIKFRYNEALGQALAWTGGVPDFEARANIEDFGRDENACTRAAIFRAAIAIGKAMLAPDARPISAGDEQSPSVAHADQQTATLFHHPDETPDTHDPV